MKYIDGGVCAPKGFKAAGVHCGIRSKDINKKDLALIVSDEMCAAAAVYTQNKVKGAPIAVTREHLRDGKAKAIVCNSGNANTCAPNGVEIAEKTCELTAKHIGADPADIIVCSTGVIGEELLMEPFEKGMPPLVKALSYEGGTMTAEAIMTTDTVSKECAVEFELDGKICRIGAAAKGSGMINPNMATMLSFITTDAAISAGMLQKALSEDIKDSYNQISVDGDTSTNDTVAIMANGMAGNREIAAEGTAFETFCRALNMVTEVLAKKLAADGEGATKLIECQVKGAPDKQTARILSKSVISSDLLKSAMFGEDANWGRVLCALGYAQADFSADDISVEMGSAKGIVKVCEHSALYPHSEEEAAEILSEKEIQIYVDLNQGKESAAAWGCDLTYDYVKINGDYRS
ncbi:bifunctional glutamate N-acetyltransferase/amino-acid acetyltransferase ArgJ [Anaerovorax odorimutans]|uniref:Arginine biosynthesis bifunctional protein ArgJ n=1 Tax=Anaerovorax odorimutans TaxID=109327 RepID=A0ABT1RJI4_9FIRM|nr:bifunctional glutamate N-acetyltransferase/amino-acid acetyltransferase ArgJ [Anaerovorax odorimutans]MCQ4635156.1 bifunctional glutamate N-acetyltransferase/amino-acid acetyltransferase ArgJ [Anaerovorax odorimutans]